MLLDSFGFGWDLFNIRSHWVGVAPQAGTLWHTQVAVLLIGHAASICWAHQAATRLFAARRDITGSQLPLLDLMASYTVGGLWILALPLGANNG